MNNCECLCAHCLLIRRCKEMVCADCTENDIRIPVTGCDEYEPNPEDPVYGHNTKDLRVTTIRCKTMS